MSERRRCISVNVVVWFDARTLSEAKRRFSTTFDICEGDDISDVAHRVATELGEAWARATKVTIRAAVLEYIEKIRDYIEHYLWTALNELLERLEEDVETARRHPNMVMMEEGSDGYYEEEEQRGFFVRVEVSFVASDIENVIDVVESVLRSRVVHPDMLRDCMLRLDRCRLSVIYPVYTHSDPHEDILEFLQIECGARWWYTIYYTQNRG